MAAITTTAVSAKAIFQVIWWALRIANFLTDFVLRKRIEGEVWAQRNKEAIEWETKCGELSREVQGKWLGLSPEETDAKIDQEGGFRD